jgi:hypothetical protein
MITFITIYHFRLELTVAYKKACNSTVVQENENTFSSYFLKQSTEHRFST